jgi:hypothetical protein
VAAWVAHYPQVAYGGSRKVVEKLASCGKAGKSWQVVEKLASRGNGGRK